MSTMTVRSTRRDRTSSSASFFASPTPFRSDRDDWATPPDLFAELDAEFHFTVDVCASRKTAKCRRYYTRRTDGLSQSWAGETAWMNPPYGRTIGLWMEKARLSARDQGATVVCLVPARVDTAWWHDNVIAGGAEVRFLRGRVRYWLDGEPGGSSPFPSAVVVFRAAR
jgi:phage N-6-adenine-methyltransferase